MTQEKINIAALLKDCPKGTKLYSPICGKCELLKETIDIPIAVKSTKYNNKYTFSEYGRVSITGECLLFPSKEVRDWGCFKAKYVHLTGDKQKDASLFPLLGTSSTYFDCDYNEEAIAYKDSVTGEVILLISEYADNPVTRDYILSTGTELKLEEEQPKFKVGDVILTAQGYKLYVTHDECKQEWYGCTVDEYSVPQNDVFARLATPEEIAKWNEETLHPNHLHYSKSKRKIIHWFLPFDKIVERCVDDDVIGEWSAGLFSHYDKENHPCYPYVTVAGMCNECLPYNPNTAMLIGTTNDYDQNE